MEHHASASGPAWPNAVPRGWLHVLFWAGLRGAVAVAMALSLPAEIPQRALLQEITFGVVLFTLLVQGTSVGWIVGLVVPRPSGADDAVGSSEPADTVPTTT